MTAVTELGPTPDLDLLRQILTQIDKHPEQWDQEVWTATEDMRVEEGARPGCGTSYCIGGWAAVLTVGTTLNDRGDEVPVGHTTQMAFYEVGQRVLGLTSAEADRLFLASSTREQVQRTAEAIAARVGATL